MDQELLKFAISQGLFAALFVWLLIDTRKESITTITVDASIIALLKLISIIN